jgi:hypothetical protein
MRLLFSTLTGYLFGSLVLVLSPIASSTPISSPSRGFFLALGRRRHRPRRCLALLRLARQLRPPQERLLPELPILQVKRALSSQISAEYAYPTESCYLRPPDDRLGSRQGEIVLRSDA